MSDDDLLSEDSAPGDAAGEQPTTSAADPKASQERRRKRDIEQEQARIFWSRVLRDAVGAREIWRLLKDLHFQEERFACGPTGFPQPEATWFHAGEQAAGQRLYQMLARQDREAVLAMHDQFDPVFAADKPQRKKRGVSDGR